MRLLLGADLHGMAHLDRIDEMRVGREARQRGLAAGPVGAQPVARQPSSGGAGRQQQSHDGGAADTQEHPPTPAAFRQPLVQPGRHGLGEQRIVEPVQPLVEAPVERDPLGGRRIAGQAARDRLRPVERQAAVGGGMQVVVADRPARHFTLLSDGPPASCRRSCSRPRCSRDITVPMGTPVIFAASA